MRNCIMQQCVAGTLVSWSWSAVQMSGKPQNTLLTFWEWDKDFNKLVSTVFHTYASSVIMYLYQCYLHDTPIGAMHLYGRHASCLYAFS